MPSLTLTRLSLWTLTPGQVAPPSLHSPKSAIFRKPWASSRRLSNFRSLRARGGRSKGLRGPGPAAALAHPAPPLHLWGKTYL
jgi:hypothetical protein